jgi:hypothetical protein
MLRVEGNMIWFGIILVVVMFVVFLHAAEKVKYGEFDDSSWWLMSFGIYIWGHGLLLAPFWILFGLACVFWWTPSMALSAYVWFHVIRSVVELLLVRPKAYVGLAPFIMKFSDKVTAEQRLHLYGLSQALVAITGIILLYTA